MGVDGGSRRGRHAVHGEWRVGCDRVLIVLAGVCGNKGPGLNHADGGRGFERSEQQVCFGSGYPRVELVGSYGENCIVVVRASLNRPKLLLLVYHGGARLQRACVGVGIGVGVGVLSCGEAGDGDDGVRREGEAGVVAMAGKRSRCCVPELPVSKK
jgi:hypothetical protein